MFFEISTLRSKVLLTFTDHIAIIINVSKITL